MKRCCTCKQYRPLSDYNIRRAAKDGLQSRCRDCSKQWYAANRDQHRANVAALKPVRRRRLQARLFEYLDEHPCVDCGEDDLRVLDFDHRDPALKRACVGAMVGDEMPWKRIRVEMEKCDVRCANCHRKRTAQIGDWGRHREQAREDEQLNADAAARLTSVPSVSRLVGEPVVAGVWRPVRPPAAATS